MGEGFPCGVLHQTLEVVVRLPAPRVEPGDLGIQQLLISLGEDFIPFLVAQVITATGLGGDLLQQLAEAFDEPLERRPRSGRSIARRAEAAMG